MADPIDISYDSVLGPILYRKPIAEHFAERLIGQTVHFFIPITEFDSATLENPPSIFGTNVYSSNSPLHVIAVHQGVLTVRSSDDPPTSYSKCLNIFSENWALLRPERRVIRGAIPEPFGLELYITFTPKLTRFEGSKQFDIKSKSTRSEMVGLAVIFGQPAFQRYETFKLKDLCSLDFERDLVDEPVQWLRFSLTGEAANSYDVHAFLDDGLPLWQWLGMKLHRQCVFLETVNERYELSMALNGQSLRFSRLKPPLQCISHLTGDGTPAKEVKKEVLHDHLQWVDIMWDDSGITVRDLRYAPVLCYFWCKRKRLVTGTPPA
jgi:hypothetical protein